MRPSLSRFKELRELKIHWNCDEIYLISTIESMKIQKITITDIDLRHPSVDGYWAELDNALSTLVKRDGYDQRLAVEIQVVYSPKGHSALDEKDYLPTFCANSNGLVKFVY